MEENLTIHTRPAWQNEGNISIRFGIYYAGTEGIQEIESLWCKQLDENLYSLCSIPFVLRNVALGDQFVVEKIEADIYRILDVTNSSSNITFRAWFNGEQASDSYQNLVQLLTKLSYEIEELQENNLIAINSSSGERCESLEKLLKELQIKVGLKYEKTTSYYGFSRKNHPNPIRGKEANAIVYGKIEVDNDQDVREALWAKYLDKNRYEVYCIPLFVYDLNLGDIIETLIDEWGCLTLDKVVQYSGNRTYWIWFNQPCSESIRSSVTNKLINCECLVEAYNRSLIAISIDFDSKLEKVMHSLKQEIIDNKIEITWGKYTVTS